MLPDNGMLQMLLKLSERCRVPANLFALKWNFQRNPNLIQSSYVSRLCDARKIQLLICNSCQVEYFKILILKKNIYWKFRLPFWKCKKKKPQNPKKATEFCNAVIEIWDRHCFNVPCKELAFHAWWCCVTTGELPLV